MKKLLAAIMIALMLMVGCASKQVNDNTHAYNHMPFKNLNWSVLGFGAYTVTIDKSFVPSGYKEEKGNLTIYRYNNPKAPWLEIILTVKDNDKPGNKPFLTIAKEDFLYKKEGRLTTVVFRNNYVGYRLYGVTVLKYRNVGGRTLYVEYRTERDSEYEPQDANHLIALFDTNINMKSEGRIVLDLPPCPFEAFNESK